MKILYTNFHTHHRGGHATYILNLFQVLHTRHLVHVADPVTSGLNEAMRALAPDCIFAQNFPKRLNELPEMLKSVRQLRRLIQKYQYDIVHVNGSPDLQLTLLACLGLKKRPAIVYTKHNSIPVNKNFFSKLKFNSAREIIVVCGCQQPEFENIGIAKERIHVIKNGMDTQHFAPMNTEVRQKMRAQLGLKPDDFVVVSSAGPSLYKRWDCMVAAVSQIPRTDIKIVIIGGLPPEADKQRFVDPYGMRDRVIFTGMQEDTRPYVAVGDISFVLSDNIETVSFACREMMSMGLPMMVSDFACLPENVTPGINGWVVKIGDVAAIKAILEDSLNHKDQLIHMGQKAREQAVREFGIQTFAEQTEAVYHQACSSSVPSWRAGINNISPGL